MPLATVLPRSMASLASLASMAQPWPSPSWASVAQLVHNGPLSLKLATNLIFFAQYSTVLERRRGSSMAFLWQLLALVGLMVLYARVVAPLSSPSAVLKDSVMYVWSAMEPETDMAVLGLFVFKAKYLPWILVLVDQFMHENRGNRSIKWEQDLASIMVGHAYWFLDQMVPKLYHCESPLKYPFGAEHLIDSDNENDNGNGDAQANAEENARGIEFVGENESDEDQHLHFD